MPVRTLGGARQLEVIPDARVGWRAVGWGIPGQLEGSSHRRGELVLLPVVVLGTAPAVATRHEIELSEAPGRRVVDQLAVQRAVVAAGQVLPLLAEGAHRP